MSEKILETLMQLFAIIAKPQSNDSERRAVVEAFLKRLLNQELVQKYLSTYDKEYDEARRSLKRAVLKGAKELLLSGSGNFAKRSMSRGSSIRNRG